MNLCCITRDLRVFALQHDDAPPHLEMSWEPDPSDSPSSAVTCCTGIRVFERLTATADPVHGIVLYEEVPR